MRSSETRVTDAVDDRDHDGVPLHLENRLCDIPDEIVILDEKDRLVAVDQERHPITVFRPGDPVAVL